MTRLLFVMLLAASWFPVWADAAPLDAAAILLGFGASYFYGDASRTHHGIDVGLASGASIESPVDGTVRFVGRVPTVDGTTVLAITLESSEGVVSLLPMDSVSVTKGDHVGVGADLGTVAPSGDPSSASTHVHLGLKRDALYLDPTALLALPAAVPEAPSEQPVVVTTPAPQAEAPSDAVQAPSAEPASVPVRAPAPRPAAAPGSTANQGAAAAAPVATVLGAATEAAGAGTEPTAMPQGVTLAPTTTQTAARAAAGGASTLHGAAPVSAGAAEASLGRLASLARSVGAPAIAAIVGVVVACSMLLARAGLQRRVQASSPVSDRLGTLLQQLRAGDTLRGLTSCSGHAAFTVPGPFSPEEVTK